MPTGVVETYLRAHVPTLQVPGINRTDTAMLLATRASACPPQKFATAQITTVTVKWMRAILVQSNGWKTAPKLTRHHNPPMLTETAKPTYAAEEAPVCGAT
jgi:hypothetical protein